MAKAERIAPTKHRAVFEYDGRRIPFSFWANEAEGTTPDTILFLGTGQVGRTPAWAAQSLPAGVVVVQGLPHWRSHPSGNDLIDFATAYTLCAFKTVLRVFGAKSLNLVGTSQAAPSTIWLANHIPDQVGNVVLLSPMGLNTASFGSTDKARFRELRRRGMRSLLQMRAPGAFDPRNLYMGGMLLAIVIAGLHDGSTVNKYTVGISHDMLGEFQLLAAGQAKRGHSLTLFLGEKDLVFPVAEIRKSLQSVDLGGVHIEVIPNLTHTSLALKAGKTYLPRVITAVRQKA